MRKQRKFAAFLATVAVCGGVAIGLNRATAQDQAAPEQSVLIPPQSAPAVEAPALAPPVAPPQPAAVIPPQEGIPLQEGSAVVVASEPVVHPAPPIVTHASLSARRMYRCHEAVNLVMATMDPATCCVYEIPLCVPACCTGAPTIESREGLLGRGVVEYCWPCGFSATVKFRHVLGDVKVEYDG